MEPSTSVRMKVTVPVGRLRGASVVSVTVSAY
jgi:hypothetical protein